MKVSVRLIAAVAVIAAIWWAKVLLIPLVLGALSSYMLDPFQRRLVAMGAPRRLAACVVLLSVLAAGYGCALVLRSQAGIVIRQLPAVTDRVRGMLSNGWSPSGAVGRVQQAAADLQRAAEGVQPTPASGVTRVEVEEPNMRVTDMLWRGSIGVITLASQVTIILFLIYYLLASGDLYKRKIVRIAGPSLSQKRVTVEILNDITQQIERFIRARIVISTIVGVATGVAFGALGVTNPIVWGLVAGVLNTIPYLGPSAVAVAAAIDGLLQFNSGTMALVLGAVSVAIATIEGSIITPWLMGKASRMNPGAVFVGLSFWGWIWGIWGFLLAVPIMITVKAVSDHIGWTMVSEMLGD